ncbi:hypothetical protein GCM10011504_59170 [Siccirubricoccus deserti]|nr:hypothetical protein GCM10011504_59170 [Siccirubricoccus deserti]
MQPEPTLNHTQLTLSTNLFFTCQRTPAATLGPKASADMRRFWKRSLIKSLVPGRLCQP